MIEVDRNAMSRQNPFSFGGLAVPGLRNRDPGAPCETSRGLEEVDSLAEHHELEGIATGLATEAVEDTLGVVDVKRWGFFGVKWAKAAVFPASLLERHRFRDQRDDIRGGTD